MTINHMQRIIVAVVATAVIVGGGAFYGGMRYERQRLTEDMYVGRALNREWRQSGDRFQSDAMLGMRGGAGRIVGEGLSRDAQSMTVSIRDGGSKIVLLGQTTEIVKSVAGTADDLTVGRPVTVVGTSNADGSVTATTIQLVPDGVRGGGRLR